MLRGVGAVTGLAVITRGLFGDGSAAAPSIAFLAAPTTGFSRSTAVEEGIPYSVAGVARGVFSASGIFVSSTSALGFLSGAVGSAADIFLVRDGADILAQRRATVAQTKRVYNTFTDFSNYERATMGWSANLLKIGAENLGTGTLRNVQLSAANLFMFSATSAGTSAASVIVIPNGTAPTTSPAGVGQLYVVAGALVYRGSSGTVTTLGIA